MARLAALGAVLALLVAFPPGWSHGRHNPHHCATVPKIACGPWLSR